MNCKLSYEFLVSLLIKAGDDVHAIDGIYETPLHWAAWTGNIKLAIGISQTNIGFDQNFLEDNYSSSRSYLDKYRTRKWNFNSTLNYKFSDRLSLRSGLLVNLMHYNFYQLSCLHQGTPLRELLNTSGNTSTQQAFAQWQYKPFDNISITCGLHYLHLQHNNSSSLEPRFTAKWNINNKSSLAVGYGLHSQLQTLNVYFAQQKQPDETVVMPNRNIDLTKAHHYVVSYGYRLARNLQIKTELYYQQLFNVPVSMYDTSSLSTLNIQNEYFTDPLTNKGKGRNYGVEILLERYLQNNFYLTLSNLIYQSKYTAWNGIERNTRFNGNYIVRFIAGKDFINVRKAKTFGINIKTMNASGLRNTPIDFAASQQAGYPVFKKKKKRILCKTQPISVPILVLL